MTDLELTRKKHINSFKVLIDSFREKANVFVSVREVRLNLLLDNAKLSTDYRHLIVEYLKNNGLLIVQGERALMRYKFIDPQIKIDSEALAGKAYEAISQIKKPAKHYTFKHPKVKDIDVETENSTINREAIITKKEYGLKDKVVFLLNNQVVQGEIVSAHFGYVKRNEEESGSGELQEDKPEVNIIKQAQISYHWNPDIEIDFAITIYDVMITSYIPERGTIIKDLNKTDIFSSLEILFQVLNVKYHHTLKLIKAK